MNDGNGCRRLYAPTEEDYLIAVREIILDLCKKGFTHKQIAQRIGVSAKTIGNAQEKKAALKGWAIARIEFEFGSDIAEPFIALGGGRNAEPALTDEIRPHVHAIATAIAERDRERMKARAVRR